MAAYPRDVACPHCGKGNRIGLRRFNSNRTLDLTCKTCREGFTSLAIERAPLVETMKAIDNVIAKFHPKRTRDVG
jgi:hypothetical protein